MKTLFTLWILFFPLQLFAWDCGEIKANTTIVILWSIIVTILLSFINFLLLKNYYIESKKEDADKKIISKIYKSHLYLLVLIPFIFITLILWDSAFGFDIIDGIFNNKLVTFLLSTLIWFSLLNKKIFKQFEITSGYKNILLIYSLLFIIMSSEILISFIINVFY
jgi:hypothetical protein